MEAFSVLEMCKIEHAYDEFVGKVCESVLEESEK
jgi:hypothetical protein